MTTLKVDTISGIGTEGTVFQGGVGYDSLNYMTLPKGTTTPVSYTHLTLPTILRV